MPNFFESGLVADFLQSPIECESGQAEMFGGQALIVAGQAHDFFDDRGIHVRERLLSQYHFDPNHLLVALRYRHCGMGSGLMQFARKVTGCQRSAVAEDHGAFDDVLQFADIAG